MMRVRVNEITYNLIRSAAEHEFVSTADRLPGGDWLVPIGEDIYERIQEVAFEGESLDDTLQRVMSAGKPRH